MDVSKLPPSNISAIRQEAATPAGQGSQAAVTVAPMAEAPDIRPLDIPGALQILLAEVRASLELDLELLSGRGAGGASQSPTLAARELVEMFLQSLPEDTDDAAAWTAALVRTDSAIQTGMDRAISIVTVWREVPQAAVDAVKEAHAQFASALGDDLRNPPWLRPEWTGLGPALIRFRRRRRAVRRRLTDPDYSTESLDEGEGYRP
jgi:hypothetical protein